jgi:hypothetical protein
LLLELSLGSVHLPVLIDQRDARVTTMRDPNENQVRRLVWRA